MLIGQRYVPSECALGRRADGHNITMTVAWTFKSHTRDANAAAPSLMHAIEPAARRRHDRYICLQLFVGASQGVVAQDQELFHIHTCVYACTSPTPPGENPKPYPCKLGHSGPSAAEHPVVPHSFEYVSCACTGSDPFHQHLQREGFCLGAAQVKREHNRAHRAGKEGMPAHGHGYLRRQETTQPLSL